jgi:leader peptidase (prepilin peptidase)/N-methyltransferase
VLTPLAIVTALLGGAWGLVADRIAARWPPHDDGSVRSIDWRTPVVVVVGAFALGGAALRFTDPVPTAVFGAYLVALVLLLGTDLDQRLLPDVVTLPAIPLAFLYSLSGANPLLPPGVLPVALVVAIVVPLGLYALSIPFGAGAIGQGDLKLLVSVGLMVGPLKLVYGAIYGALVAGVVLAVLLAARRITLKTFVPYGPFLILGAIWAVLVIR